MEINEKEEGKFKSKALEQYKSGLKKFHSKKFSAALSNFLEALCILMTNDRNIDRKSPLYYEVNIMIIKCHMGIGENGEMSEYENAESQCSAVIEDYNKERNVVVDYFVDLENTINRSVLPRMMSRVYWLRSQCHVKMRKKYLALDDFEILYYYGDKKFVDEMKRKEIEKFRMGIYNKMCLGVCKEFVTSEKVYVESLKVLLEGFVDQMKENEHLLSPKFFEEAPILDLSRKILNRFHMKFLEDLEKIKISKDRFGYHEELVDLVIENGGKFMAYKMFSGYQFSDQRIKKEIEENKVFREFIEERQKELREKAKKKRKTGISLRFEDLYSKTFQRITKYPLLLKVMKKGIEKSESKSLNNSPFYRKVLKAWMYTQKAVVAMNSTTKETRRQKEMVDVCLHLQKKYACKNILRKLIYAIENVSYNNVIVIEGSGIKIKKAELFIFEDRIVIGWVQSREAEFIEFIDGEKVVMIISADRIRIRWYKKKEVPTAPPKRFGGFSDGGFSDGGGFSDVSSVESRGEDSFPHRNFKDYTFTIVESIAIGALVKADFKHIKNKDKFLFIFHEEEDTLESNFLKKRKPNPKKKN